MKKRELRWIVLVIAALTLAVTGGAMAAAKTTFLAIATGGTGGTYYPLGGALAQAISENAEGISATAQSGNASVANCNLIARGDVETAFVQNNVADEAYNGRGAFQGHAVSNLRVIAALYPETVQVVARKASNVKNLSEAKGKIIAVGDKGSGTEVDTRNILSLHNLTYDDIKPLYVNFSVAAQRLQDDQGDILFTTAGYPTSSIIELMTGKECNFVNLDPEAVKKLCEKFPFYVPITIPAGTYKGQTEPVNTVAMMALWVTHSGLDAEVVYKATKALWAKGAKGESGAAMLAKIHDQGKNIKLETALKGVTIPLHPGAEKFYMEAGVLK
ncbi:MAG: TAXI family TRAP transporter solute-binding subunit [Syntrophobacteraceae bacterium]